MALKTYLYPLVILFFGLQGAVAKDKTIVHSVSKQDMLLLRNVDQKYQKNHGIHLTLKKTIILGMLGTEKTSEGEIWLNDGKMRLQIHKPEASQIVADKKYLWIESAPPGSSIRTPWAELWLGQETGGGQVVWVRASEPFDLHLHAATASYFEHIQHGEHRLLLTILDRTDIKNEDSPDA